MDIKTKIMEQSKTGRMTESSFADSNRIIFNCPIWKLQQTLFFTILSAFSRRIHMNMVFGVVLLTFMVSCKNDIYYEQFRTIDDDFWKTSDSLVFDIPVGDTTDAFNMYIHLRNTGEYRWRNIYFFVTTHAPSGDMVTDTVEYFLADESGKWYGKGWGNIWNNQLPYKMNIKFPYTGIYTVILKHGMRKDLQAVLDAGIIIEKKNR